MDYFQFPTDQELPTPVIRLYKGDHATRFHAYVSFLEARQVQEY
jgi:hypothetical protein